MDEVEERGDELLDMRVVELAAVGEVGFQQLHLCRFAKAFDGKASEMVNERYSVAREEVAGVYFGEDVGEVGAGAVGHDGSAAALERGKVVDYLAAEEG